MRGNFSCKSELEESLGFPREEGKSSPNDLAVFTRTYGRCLLSGLLFRRSGGEAAQSSLLPVKQLEAPVYLLEREGVGIDLLNVQHVLENRDGASSKVAKQRGVAVMPKACYPARTVRVQEILRFCCRTDFGEGDV